jgi:DNA-binding beta-propeller fold protein YncE
VKNSVVKTLTDAPQVVSPTSGPGGVASGLGDAVWLVDKTGTKKYIYLNENTGNNRVHVYDSTTQTYLGFVNSTTSGKPLHLYAIPFRYEVWGHLDNVGGFDVLDADSITTKKQLAYRVSAINPNVKAPPPTSQHGKMLSETELGDYAFESYVDQSQLGKFATSGQVAAINLATKSLISVLNISRSTDAYPVSRAISAHLLHLLHAAISCSYHPVLML